MLKTTSYCLQLYTSKVTHIHAGCLENMTIEATFFWPLYCLYYRYSPPRVFTPRQTRSHCEPIVLSWYYESNYNNIFTLLAQSSGTELLKMLLAIVSRACDITTSPFNALSRSLSVCLTVSRSLLYLITSWINTVFIDSSYLTGCFSITMAMGIGWGTFSRMPRPASSITFTTKQNKIKINK